MKPNHLIFRGPVAWLAVLMLQLATAIAADESAIQAEIETVRKAALERYKDRLPDNFETYVRDTGRRNYYQRAFTTALTNGNAAEMAVVFQEYPEVAQPKYLNGSVIKGKPALHYAVEHGHNEIFELLLKQKVGADTPRPSLPGLLGGKSLSSSDPLPAWARRETPLHVAVRAGRVELAKRLLDEGADVEALDERGESPLSTNVRLLASVPYSAIPQPVGSDGRERQDRLLTLLLQRGASVLTTNRGFSGLQPMSVVYSTRNLELLDRLLTNCTVLAATNSDSDSLVHLAVMNGRTNALQVLLARRAPANFTNRAGFTPLQSLAWLRPPPRPSQPSPNVIYVGPAPLVSPLELAAGFRQQSADLLLAANVAGDVFSFAGLTRTNELAALLRQTPALAGASDALGRSPLHYAVRSGGVPAVQTLLQARAPTELRDRSGLTPLLFALYSSRVEEVPVLIASGASVTATNTNGQTVLHLAVHLGKTNLLGPLLQAGADLNARDVTGKSPVEEAAAAGQFTVVKWLQEQGAVVTAREQRLMSTPLHQAIRNGSLPQLQETYKWDAELNSRDERGRTPLRLAVDANRADLAHFLLSKGANPNVPDTNGITPLRVQFVAANDPIPDPVPKPGFSKRSTASKGAKENTAITDSLPPALRPTVSKGPPPLTNLLLLLLESGADPKLPDAEGKTMLHGLLPVVRGQTPELLQRTEDRVQLLVNYGLPVDTRAPGGLTPLHLAAARGDLVNSYGLLQAGASMDATDVHGQSALHHLFLPPPSRLRPLNVAQDHQDRPQTLALLLRAGADLRRANTNGSTALHLLPALEEGLGEMLLPVLKTNRHFAAALRLKDKGGRTPVLLLFEQLRAKPVTPVARLLAAVLDAGGEVPPTDGHASTTVLHELAAITAVHPPSFSNRDPDATASEALAKLAARAVAKAANLEVRNAQGETPLHVATRHQHATFAAALLARGANPNARTPQGDTPLHLALQGLGTGSGGNPVIPLLVSNKCDLLARNAAGESPLHMEVTRRFNTTPLFLPPGATDGFFPAARKGDVASVDAYLKLDPTLATMVDPATQASALRSAALNEQMELAERLRLAGATDPLSAAVLGWTNSLAVFLRANPRLGETNFGYGLSLLHLAASRGQDVAVQMLLTDQISPGIEDFVGRTVLYHAANSGSSNLVTWLVAHGARHTVYDAIALADAQQLETLLTAEPARGNATNRIGVSPLFYAVDLGNKDAVQRLLAHGVDPNQAFSPRQNSLGRFISGTVPLHVAAWSNRMDLAELLVAAKAGVTAVNDRGYTALHFAAANGHEGMAQWLLARGANPNSQTVVTNTPERFPPMNAFRVNSGWTPLHLAVRYAQPALIELLVAKGAKLDAKDAQGQTPADFTQEPLEMLRPALPPSPYGSHIPSMPGTDGPSIRARAQAAMDTLKKLGAAIPATRGPGGADPRFPPAATPPAKR